MMAKCKTCPGKWFAEADFNSEPYLSEFKRIYQDMHASGCPFAHSTTGDHYAVASHKEIISIFSQIMMPPSKLQLAFNDNSRLYQNGVKSLNQTTELFAQHTADAKDKLRDGWQDKENMVTRLLSAQYDEGGGSLFDAMILATMLFFLAAGSGTTTNLLSNPEFKS